MSEHRWIWAGGLSSAQQSGLVDYLSRVNLGDLPPATATALAMLENPLYWEEVVLTADD